MFKKLLFVFALTFSISFASQAVEKKEIGNLILENIPEIPERIKNNRLRYQNVRSSSFSGWSNSENGMYIKTRFGETSQVHFVDSPGSRRSQLTFFNEPIRTVVPHNKGFLFSKDIGGNEAYQIFNFDRSNGKSEMITDGESRNGAIVYSNLGDKFAYFSTKRNGKDWDIYVSNISKPYKTKLVLETKGAWMPASWSEDDSRILLYKYISANESSIYILNLKNNKLEQINPNKKVSYGWAEFSKNKNGIYFTSDENEEFRKLKYYDLNTSKTETITKKINWNVEDFVLSKNGEKLAYSINEDGISKLHIINTKYNSEIKVPQLPIGIIYGIHFDNSDKIAFTLNTSKNPGDVYSINLDNKSLSRWTYSEVGGLNTDKFITPELIHFKTFDKVNKQNRKIPAFYFKPKEKINKKIPVLIRIHGGPESQYRPYFSSSVQYFVNELKIAYIAPNVRGSSGYGKSYLLLDNGYKRENSVKDIGALLDWIKENPELDENKVIVMGGSYGGYMTLASMIKYNNRLKGGIDSVGISNFVTFLKNTKDYRRDLRRVEYGDERDPKMYDFLMKISPTTNSNKINKPIFIVQGLNDPRVPESEASQMVSEIRKNSGSVWYLLAKDEGHGFRKKKNRDFLSNAIIFFLEESF